MPRLLMSLRLLLERWTRRFRWMDHLGVLFGPIEMMCMINKSWNLGYLHNASRNTQLVIVNLSWFSNM